MLKKLQKKSEGFTIIEVMIVLAIAGLILLIVFLAVPALQRNSRNTQRKNDVSALLGGINEFTNNHNGRVPATLAEAIGNTNFGYYQTAANRTFANNNTAIGAAALTIENIHIRTGARCNAAGTNVGGATPSARGIAVVYTVETGGGGTNPVCQES